LRGSSPTKSGAPGVVVHSDINHAMLAAGRDKLLDTGLTLPTVQCNAETLPFGPRTFDVVSIAFGLRNVTRKEAALAEMRRVLRPGGAALVLEFSRVAPSARAALRLVQLQRACRGSAKSSPTTRRATVTSRNRSACTPTRARLAQMMEQAGFDRVEYQNLMAGVVAIHVGRVY
jgi:demethylmenaquinone methyltransferase/2-methoxy-6-polyprenyl-1,4-benzoquinol methylase